MRRGVRPRSKHHQIAHSPFSRSAAPQSDVSRIQLTGVKVNDWSTRSA
jgi:hypothetical protein